MELIEFKMEGKVIQVFVTQGVKAYFNEQFVRDKPSVRQKKHYTTIMNLMRAAYDKGREDAKRSNGH